jgi:haloacetate dehalogenase
VAALTDLFPGFAERRVTTTHGRAFRLVTAGEGPVVLLLHGWPQTLATWHRIAPALVAAGYRVVAPDLPGYGQSDAVAGEVSRRTIAAGIAGLMGVLGHERYAVVGHDRGARAGYRLALDFAERVVAYASLTVAPTLDVWEGIDGGFALRAPHWFFFALPPDLLEQLIGAAPVAYLDHVLAGMAGGLDQLDDRALADYRAAIARASVRRAMFDDYRAAAGIDLDHERADRAAGRRLACPVLYLWSTRRPQADPLDVWRRWAADVSGAGIDHGHLQPERAPHQVLPALLPFLARCFSGSSAS